MIQVQDQAPFHPISQLFLADIPSPYGIVDNNYDGLVNLSPWTWALFMLNLTRLLRY